MNSSASKYEAKDDGDDDLDEMMAAVENGTLPGTAETPAAARDDDDGVDQTHRRDPRDAATIETRAAAGPITREEVQLLLAPRDEVLAGLLQAVDATQLASAAASKERRALESDLVHKYGKAGVTGTTELDIVSEYTRMVAVFLILSAAGWIITVLDIVGVFDGARGDAMARAMYASTFPMSVTICPMLYYGTLGFGVILSDARLNIVCYVAFIVDGLCYGEEFFDAGWVYPYIFTEVSSSQGGGDYGSTPTLVMGAIYALVVFVVFGWLGVNTLALGRRKVLERKLSLPHFSETFCSTSMKVFAFQAFLGVMQVVNVATAQDAEQLAKAVRINEASFSFSVALGAGYVTKVLIFDVPGLTTHAFFNGKGSRWSVVGVVCALVGALTSTAGWLLAYQTHGSSSSTSFDVAAVLGNISCSALTAANAASTVNFMKSVPGGCGRFVRRGAEAAWQLRNEKETDFASMPTDTSPNPAGADT